MNSSVGPDLDEIALLLAGGEAWTIYREGQPVAVLIPWAKWHRDNVSIDDELVRHSHNLATS